MPVVGFNLMIHNETRRPTSLI